MNAKKIPPKILVVEDSDSKWNEIDILLNELCGENKEIVRAKTMVDAETLAISCEWTLLVLDISLDITASATGPKHGGYDSLGGLRVANKMFLLEKEAPTIIVTAFDAFPTGKLQRGRSVILGLEDVREKASSLLGESFLGCVRYGDPEWKEAFNQLAEGVIGK